MERTLDPVTLEPAVGKTNMLVRADVADREDRSLMAIERDRTVLPFGGEWLAVDHFGSVRNAGPIAHHSSYMPVLEAISSGDILKRLGTRANQKENKNSIKTEGRR